MQLLDFLSHGPQRRLNCTVDQRVALHIIIADCKLVNCISKGCKCVSIVAVRIKYFLVH